MNNNNKKEPHTCRNCGHIGHLYRDCSRPITSFGIICYRMNSTPINTEYLMIQRKDSLCFMEFIRGKYDLKNSTYIRHLLSGMTQDERKLLLSKTFDELWNYVWYQPCMPRQTNEYNHAKTKFDTLFNGVIHGDSKTNSKVITLAFLIETSISIHDDPEWGFPKGRRKVHEEDLKCAVREFTEETCIMGNDIEIDENMPPFEEIFFGTNNVLYRHVYYIAHIKKNVNSDIRIDPTNINQAREVRAIKWFTFADGLVHIREHNSERKELFQQIHKLILQKYS